MIPGITPTCRVRPCPLTIVPNILATQDVRSAIGEFAGYVPGDSLEPGNVTDLISQHIVRVVSILSPIAGINIVQNIFGGVSKS